ncbi:hypothetical protein ABZ746_23760 [Streptomyces sp. NPDC020096]
MAVGEEAVRQDEDAAEGKEGTVTAAEARQVAAERLEEARRLQEEMIAELPPEEQEEIRAAQRELAALGAEVDAVVKWWGFEIHLNAQAAEMTATIIEEVGKIVSKFPKLKPFAPLIKLVCKIRATLIKEVGKTYGCKLVSPWIAPAMLIPLSLAPKEDTSLWWTVFEEGNDEAGKEKGWSGDERFPAHASQYNPALADFGGKLHCVHRGGGVDASLWQAVYNPDDGWDDDVAFPRHGTDAGPAVAVYRNKLYCVHKANQSGNAKLWWTVKSSPASQWEGDREFSRHSTSAGPALAVFKDNLYCVHRGGGSDANLWYTVFNPTKNDWDADLAISGAATSSNPALAVFNDKLYCVHKGNNDNSLWWTVTSDGVNWERDKEFSQHGTQAGPALAVFNDKLYCVHRGNRDQSLWWTVFNPSTNSWSQDRELSNHASNAGPALIVYRDKNGTHSQLMCVHRGFGKK